MAFNLGVVLGFRPEIASLNKTAETIRNTLNKARVTGSPLPATFKSDVDSFNKSVRETSAQIAITSSRMEKLGSLSALALRRFTAFSVSTGLVFGFTRAVTSAVAESIEFQRELVRIGQVSGVTADGLSKIGTEISNLSKKYGTNSTELSKIATIIAQTGRTAKETRDILNAVAESSLAPTFGDMESTTEGLIAALGQFNIAANKSKEVLGSINAVAAAYPVEAQDIIEAIRRTGGVFAQASNQADSGITKLQQFIATFSAIRGQTRETAESIATGLRTIFSTIQRQSTQKKLADFGVEGLTNSEGKFVGVFEAVNKLSIALKKLSSGAPSPELAGILEELGGIRQIGKTIPLITQMGNRLDALKVAQAGVNSTEKDAALGQQALQVQLAKTREEFNSLIRDIVLSDGFKKMTDSVLTLARSFIELGNTLKPIIPLLTVFAGAKLLSASAKFARGFTTERKNPGILASGSAIGSFLPFNTGGLVPGKGPNKDSVKAYLTKGEYVLNRRAVDSIGVSRLNALNSVGGGRDIAKSEDGVIYANKGGLTGVNQKIRKELIASSGADEVQKKAIQKAVLDKYKKLSASVGASEANRLISQELRQLQGSGASGILNKLKGISGGALVPIASPSRNFTMVDDGIIEGEFTKTSTNPSQKLLGRTFKPVTVPAFSGKSSYTVDNSPISGGAGLLDNKGKYQPSSSSTRGFPTFNDDVAPAGPQNVSSPLALGLKSQNSIQKNFLLPDPSTLKQPYNPGPELGFADEAEEEAKNVRILNEKAKAQRELFKLQQASKDEVLGFADENEKIIKQDDRRLKAEDARVKGASDINKLKEQERNATYDLANANDDSLKTASKAARQANAQAEAARIAAQLRDRDTNLGFAPDDSANTVDRETRRANAQAEANRIAAQRRDKDTNLGLGPDDGLSGTEKSVRIANKQAEEAKIAAQIRDRNSDLELGPEDPNTPRRPSTRDGFTEAERIDSNLRTKNAIANLPPDKKRGLFSRLFGGGPDGPNGGGPGRFSALKERLGGYGPLVALGAAATIQQNVKTSTAGGASALSGLTGGISGAAIGGQFGGPAGAIVGGVVGAFTQAVDTFQSELEKVSTQKLQKNIDLLSIAIGSGSGKDINKAADSFVSAERIMERAQARRTSTFGSSTNATAAAGGFSNLASYATLGLLGSGDDNDARSARAEIGSEIGFFERAKLDADSALDFLTFGATGGADRTSKREIQARNDVVRKSGQSIQENNREPAGELLQFIEKQAGEGKDLKLNDNVFRTIGLGTNTDESLAAASNLAQAQRDLDNAKTTKEYINAQKQLNIAQRQAVEEGKKQVNAITAEAKAYKLLVDSSVLSAKKVELLGEELKNLSARLTNASFAGASQDAKLGRLDGNAFALENRANPFENTRAFSRDVLEKFINDMESGLGVNLGVAKEGVLAGNDITSKLLGRFAEVASDPRTEPGEELDRLNDVVDELLGSVPDIAAAAKAQLARQFGTTGDSKSLAEFVKTLDASSFSGGITEASEEVTAKLFDNLQKITNDYVTTLSQINAEQIRINQERLVVESSAAENALELARLQGKSLSVEQLKSPLLNRVSALSGTTSVSGISENISRGKAIGESLSKELQSFIDNSDEPAKEAQLALIAKNNEELQNNQEALRLLATDTRGLTAVQDKIKALQEQENNKRGLIERLATGSPEDILGVNRDIAAASFGLTKGFGGLSGQQRGGALGVLGELGGSLLPPEQAAEFRDKLLNSIVGGVFDKGGLVQGFNKDVAGLFDLGGSKRLGDALKAEQDLLIEAQNAQLNLTEATIEVKSGTIVDRRDKQLNANKDAINRNTGGYIPGRGPNRDSVPAMLTKGEFVVNRDATDANYDLLAAINNGYVKGGYVSAGRQKELDRRERRRKSLRAEASSRASNEFTNRGYINGVPTEDVLGEIDKTPSHKPHPRNQSNIIKNARLFGTSTINGRNTTDVINEIRKNSFDPNNLAIGNEDIEKVRERNRNKLSGAVGRKDINKVRESNLNKLRNDPLRKTMDAKVAAARKAREEAKKAKESGGGGIFNVPDELSTASARFNQRAKTFSPFGPNTRRTVGNAGVAAARTQDSIRNVRRSTLLGGRPNDSISQASRSFSTRLGNSQATLSTPAGDRQQQLDYNLNQASLNFGKQYTANFEPIRRGEVANQEARLAFKAKSDYLRQGFATTPYKAKPSAGPSMTQGSAAVGGILKEARNAEIRTRQALANSAASQAKYQSDLANSPSRADAPIYKTTKKRLAFNSGGAVGNKGGGRKSSMNFTEFVSASNNLVSAINPFVQAINQFSSVLSSVNIPSKIEMTGRHDVNVVVNGAEVLASMSEPIRNLVMSEINKGIGRHMNTVTGETKESVISPSAITNRRV